MNKRILLVLCLLMTAVLCGCRSSIIEGTEITVRGVVTDTSYATVEEKPYGILEKAYPRTLVESEDGETTASSECAAMIWQQHSPVILWKSAAERRKDPD